MKAKRRVCALLFSALMIWQGFMIVNAEGVLAAAANGAPSPVAEAGSTTTVPGASGSGEPAQQDSGTVTQAGADSQTATGSAASGEPATAASSAEMGETTAPENSLAAGETAAPVNSSAAEETAASVNSSAAGEADASVYPSTAGQPAASASLVAGETAAVAGAVRSQHQPTLVNDVIQNAEIYLDGNNPVKLEDQLINRITVLQLKADLIIEGKELYEGDYAEIVLPSELKSYSKAFDITAPGNVVVAKGEYDARTNTIRITFTKAIETINKANGNFFFKMQMNKDKATETKHYDLDIKVGGNTLTRKVNYDAKFVEEPKTFFKDTVAPNGEVIQKIKVNDKDHYLVRYQVTFDAAHFGTPGKDYKNVVFTDALGSPALSYFDPAHQHPALPVANATQYQPVMQKGVWRTYDENKTTHETVVAPDDTNEHRGAYWSLRDKGDNNRPAKEKPISPTYYEENGVKKFKVTLGDIGKNEGVVLMYYAEIVGEIPVKGASYKNNASLKSDGGDLNTPSQEKKFTINNAGGSVGQNPFTIKVRKTGENGALLQGAIFKLRSKTDGSDRNLITDANGEAVINNAIRDNYELVEIQAPEGYQLDPTPRQITTDDFDRAVNPSGGVIEVTVTNRKTPNPPPTPNNPPTPGNPPTPNNPPTPGNPPTPNTPPTPGNPPTPNNPPTPGTPPIPGTPPTTPPTPGQVLGARRYPEGRGGQEQEKPAVLGTRRGRGSADTSDHSASDIHWLLFGFGTAGLFAICINELVGLEKLLHRRKSRR